MALQKDIELNNGLFVEKAYIRINTISGFKDEITLSVNSYLSQKSFLDGVGYLEQKFYTFTPDVFKGAQEIWSQGYNKLKSLEEFHGASDC